MKILIDLEESIKLHKITNLTAERIKNAFCANYLAAMVFLRCQDLQGLQLINDPTHAQLKSWSNDMSEVNFWGKVLFSPDKEVTKRLSSAELAIFAQDANQILDTRVKAFMKVPLTAPHLINWDEVCAMLTLLRYRLEITSSYYSKILNILCTWDRASANDKHRIISLAFGYLQQSDPQSASLERLRAILDHSATSLEPKNIGKLINFLRINEDGEGDGDADDAGTVTGNIGSVQNAIIGGSSYMGPSGKSTVNKEIDLGGLFRLNKKAPWQVNKTVKVGKFVFRGGKPIKKKVRRWNPIKFKEPAHMRPTKVAGEKKDDVQKHAE